MWAYLPVGPLERQIRRGSQGVSWEELLKEPSRESYLPLAGNRREPLLVKSSIKQRELPDNQKIPVFM